MIKHQATTPSQEMIYLPPSLGTDRVPSWQIILIFFFLTLVGVQQASPWHSPWHRRWVTSFLDLDRRSFLEEAWT